MLQTRIDWKKVQIKMAEREIRTFLELAAGAGVHKNTLSRRKTSFISTTVDRLADYLGCDPLDIITSVEVAVNNAEPPPPTPVATSTRQGQRDALRETSGRGGITPEEEERRAAFLAQAAGRSQRNSGK